MNVMDLKPMVYSAQRTCLTLAAGEINGFCFKIMNLGTHPTAYIKIPATHGYYGQHYNDCPVKVHGGLTYGEHEEDGYWVGWDYAHYGDYTGNDELYPSELRLGGKRWTTQEILKDVRNAVRQLARRSRTGV